MSFYVQCTCGCGAALFAGNNKQEAENVFNNMKSNFEAGIVDDILASGGEACKEAFGLELVEE